MNRVSLQYIGIILLILISFIPILVWNQNINGTIQEGQFEYYPVDNSTINLQINYILERESPGKLSILLWKNEIPDALIEIDIVRFQKINSERGSFILNEDVIIPDEGIRINFNYQKDRTSYFIIYNHFNTPEHRVVETSQIAPIEEGSLFKYKIEPFYFDFNPTDYFIVVIQLLVLQSYLYGIFKFRSLNPYVIIRLIKNPEYQSTDHLSEESKIKENLLQPSISNRKPLILFLLFIVGTIAILWIEPKALMFVYVLLVLIIIVVLPIYGSISFGSKFFNFGSAIKDHYMLVLSFILTSTLIFNTFYTFNVRYQIFNSIIFISFLIAFLAFVSIISLGYVLDREFSENYQQNEYSKDNPGFSSVYLVFILSQIFVSIIFVLIHRSDEYDIFPS